MPTPIIGTLSLSGSTTFAGSDGWTCGTLSLTAAGAFTITLQNSITYTTTTSVILTGGTNAFLVGSPGSSPNSDHGKFNCTGAPYSSVASLKTAIMNLSKWVYSGTGSTIYNIPPGCNYYCAILTAASQTNVSCNGASNGSATVSPSDPLGPLAETCCPLIVTSTPLGTVIGIRPIRDIVDYHT